MGKKPPSHRSGKPVARRSFIDHLLAFPGGEFERLKVIPRRVDFGRRDGGRDRKSRR